MQEKISTQSDKVAQLTGVVEEARRYREGRNIHLMRLCRQAGKRAERRRVFGIAGILVGILLMVQFIDRLLIGKLHGVYLYGIDFHLVLLIAVVFMLGIYAFLQFWVIPDFLFGSHITRVRENAAREKAKELKIDDLYDEYEFSWTNDEIRKSEERQDTKE